jgi:homoserine kinase type II
MDMEQNSEIKEILKQYDIGELTECEQNDRGYVNTSYAIETLAGGSVHKYFLRRYKKGIKKDDLDFEHSLINYLVDNKFTWVAGVVKTRDGNTYVHKSGDDPQGEGVYYAIFDYLSGEDRYTWVNPICKPEELVSAAQILAQYHQTGFGFTPQGMRSDPDISNLLPEIRARVRNPEARTKNTLFDTYLSEHSGVILRCIEEALAAICEPECKAGVKLAIHCDYHPGNLKFTESRATGLFDFDWSKIDYRSFDVALAIFYFFTSWGEQDGVLRLNEIALFLNAYQNALKELPGVGPLSPGELKYFPDMINAGNLYVLNWTILDYDQKDVDPQEYLVYLRHSVNLIQWLVDPEHQEALKNVLLAVESGELPSASDSP